MILRVGIDIGSTTVKVVVLDEENKLDDKGNVKSDYTKKRDIADQLEQKYNIKIEYAKLNTDGYDEISAVVTPITNGEAHADIFCGRESVMIGAREYLADITADVDQLEIGSTYIEPGTFGGKVLGWTYDDMGNAYVLAYSRSYLKSIGMEKTPTDMFMEGKWDYDSCRTYLSDLKAKLPDGTYPISVHPNHWSSMGPAANGVVRVDSDSNVNFLEQGYISAMEFYRSLVVDQLAGQTEIKEITETGGISLDIPYGTGDMSGKAGEPGKYVLTMVEAWQFEDVLKKTEDWGIVPFLTQDKDALSKGCYVFVPHVREAILSGNEAIKAYVIREGQVKEITLSIGGLTPDEKKVIAAGCLINYYRD